VLFAMSILFTMPCPPPGASLPDIFQRWEYQRGEFETPSTTRVRTSFTQWRKLGLWIDLTNTDRCYFVDKAFNRKFIVRAIVSLTSLYHTAQ
ncbi:hypothetical protein KIN20_006606, partial [Parelaphostrongylus tenuis]